MKQNTGYVTDVTYPPHFHKEMQPVWLTSLADFLGSTPPDLSRPFSYCELGCGLGINLLISAATCPKGQFLGVDMNPHHLALAQEAARSMGLDNIHFVHADFASFAQRNNLFFDFIVCHGTWSWIAPTHQQSILQIVKQSLKPKGLFYLHYMCHPGATHLIPLQKLLNELASHLPTPSEQSVQTGMALLNRLSDAGVFIDQPVMEQHLQALQQKPSAYLAHEFLTDHWHPEHSSDLHQQVAQTDASYIGSADPFNNLNELSIPGAVQPLLNSLPSQAIKEQVKDLARNQHQRLDLFQRQPVQNTLQTHLERVDAIRFTLLPNNAPASGDLIFKTAIGDIPGPAELFVPLLDRLAKSSATFNELRHLPAFEQAPNLLSSALQMLMWQGQVHPMLPDQSTDPQTIKQMKDWINQQRLALTLIPECGTATHTTSAN